MVSSIILEGIGTPLFYAPFYSIVRAVSVSPTSLLLTKGILAQPKRFFLALISMLVILEVLVTVACPFLSTIIISDFMASSFINSNNLTKVGIYSPLGFVQAAWWRVPPASSWTFGKLAESFSQGPNFHDTGHTYQAFIHFKDEAQRTSLRSFQGPAKVMDQRVVCVSPSFVYYENLLREDPIASVLTALSSTALIPVRWGGFVAGVSILVAHVIILALITVLFVIFTTDSMIGNNWRAIAQAVSEDMLAVLDQASKMKDEEVKKRWGKGQLADHGALRYWPNWRVAIGVGEKERIE